MVTMRDSGIPWLGEIPNHWQVTRLKLVATVQSGLALGKNYGNEELTEYPYLRVANVQDGYLDLSEIKTVEVSERDAQGCRLQAGDVLMNEGGDADKLGRGAIWTGEIDPCLHQNHVFAVRPYRVLPRWLNLWTSADGAKAFFESRAKQSTNLASISATNLKELPVPLPPPETQRAIADFLDAETARIDALIAAKENLLAILAEKRRALVTQAVTRGLNPSVPMRDSGIPWLAEIPEHWEVTRLKLLAAVQSGLALGKKYGNEELTEYPYLRVANVQDGYLDLSEVKTVEVSERDAIGCRLQAGDVLMNEGGDADKLGRGAIWTGEIDPCLHQNHVFAVRPRRVSSQWLNLWTSGDGAKAFFESRAKQSTNLASISATNLKELPIPIPPVEEQESLVQLVRQELEKVGRFESAMHTTISLLRERREAVIAAAVTGQLQPEA